MRNKIPCTTPYGVIIKNIGACMCMLRREDERPGQEQNERSDGFVGSVCSGPPYMQEDVLV